MASRRRGRPRLIIASSLEPRPSCAKGWPPLRLSPVGPPAAMLSPDGGHVPSVAEAMPRANTQADAKTLGIVDCVGPQERPTRSHSRPAPSRSRCRSSSMSVGRIPARFCR
jgi:hypothetical protein